MAIKKYPTIRHIPLRDIYIAVNKFEREEPVQKRVSRLAGGWDWPSYDPVKLYTPDFPNDEGRPYEVYEGGHRIRAALELGMTTLPALIFPINDLKAAQVFNDQDKFKVTVKRYDHHKALCFRKIPESLAIEATVVNNGFTIVPTNINGATMISAVGSIYNIARRTSVQHLSDTLAFAQEVWIGDQKLSDGGFLGGLAEFLDSYGDKVTPQAREKLSGLPITRFLAIASGYQQSTRRTAVASALRSNSGIRKDKKLSF